LSGKPVGGEENARRERGRKKRGWRSVLQHYPRKEREGGKGSGPLSLHERGKRESLIPSRQPRDSIGKGTQALHYRSVPLESGERRTNRGSFYLQQREGKSEGRAPVPRLPSQIIKGEGGKEKTAMAHHLTSLGGNL